MTTLSQLVAFFAALGVVTAWTAVWWERRYRRRLFVDAYRHELRAELRAMWVRSLVRGRKQDEAELS